MTMTRNEEIRKEALKWKTDDNDVDYWMPIHEMPKGGEK